MKYLMSLICSMVLLCLTSTCSAAVKWETDYEKAAESAKASNRYLLLDFSGSDWCGWCMKLDDQVFSKKDFKKYAEENLVCVLVDFPRSKSLKKSLKEQNDALARKYGIRGYPSVLILSPSGELVGRTGYKEGGAEAYVAHLKEFIDPHRKANGVPATSSVSVPAPPAPAAAAGAVRDEPREMRTWRSNSGATITASLVEEQPPFVVLMQQDGARSKISAELLSAEDQTYIASQRTPASP